MTLIIDEGMALDLLKAAVVERGPDYVYEVIDSSDRCLYWHQEKNEPGCIVGLVLFNKGVTPDSLIDVDNEVATAARHLSSYKLMTATGETVWLSEKALDLFSRVQRFQDTGSPWGEALSVGLEAA